MTDRADRLFYLVRSRILFGLKHNGRDVVPDVKWFDDLPSVRDCRADLGGFKLTVKAPHECIPALVTRLSVHSLELTRLTTRHVSLEDVFVTLTGRNLTAEELADKAP